jgi:hypothetical protein
MSPSTGAGARPQGTGAGGKITPGDIKSKAEAVVGGVDDQIQQIQVTKGSLLKYAAVGGALAVVLISFWLGRRSGRRRSTVVEIRRG